MARRLLVGASLVAALLAAAPAALADGDPASDYLLSQPLFVGFDVKVPDAQLKRLRAVIADAHAKGYEIRVAVLATRFDMGSVYTLWRKPKLYTRFLGQELFFVYKGRLLVVMPSGYGVSRGGAALAPQQRLVDRLPAPGPSPAAMAGGAAVAVQKLAAEAGVQVALPSLSSSGGSSSRDRIFVGAGVGVLILLVSGASFFWRRRGA